MDPMKNRWKQDHCSWKVFHATNSKFYKVMSQKKILKDIELSLILNYINQYQNNWPTAWICGNETGILPYYPFPLKGLKILHRERRGQVSTVMMEQFNSILLHKSGLANKQHTNQSIVSYNGTRFKNIVKIPV